MSRDFTEEYVCINGITQYFLHYPAPAKPVVLYLHGGPGQTEAHFVYHTNVSRDFCSFVYYDQRGTGKTQRKSKTKPEDITFENLLEDLRLTIRYVKEKYQTDQVILLAHSWGTVLGTSYIRQYPHDVCGYIGFGQVVDILRGEAICYEKFRQVIGESGNKSGSKALKRLGEYPPAVMDESFLPAVTRFRRLQGRYGLFSDSMGLAQIFLKSPVLKLSDLLMLSNNLRVNKNLVNIFLTYSILSDTEYELPVYYVLGRNDWQVPSALAAEYFQRIHAPQKGLFWVENAGHMTDVDNPSQFNRAVETCVQEICGSVYAD